MASRRPGAALLLVPALALTLLAGCARTIAGSGPVVTRKIPVASFKRLEVGSAFQVRVVVRRAESLTVRISDNLRDRLDVGVRNGVLRVRLQPRLSVTTGTLEADVGVRTLEAITASGAARVRLAAALAVPSLQVDLTGASRLAGALDADRLTANLSGASSADLRGHADRCTLKASGASQLELSRLAALDVGVELAGASSARVWARDTVAADLSGASTLAYRGNPRFTRKDLAGASSIERLS